MKTYSNDPKGYAERVQELELEGLTTSDAQSVASVEFENRNNWDIKSIKAKLPDVLCRLKDGRLSSCQITGNKGNFARVYLPDGGSVEAHWKTLIHCLNSKRPLIV